MAGDKESLNCFVDRAVIAEARALLPNRKVSAFVNAMLKMGVEWLKTDPNFWKPKK